jgi:hypothetical protein
VKREPPSVRGKRLFNLAERAVVLPSGLPGSQAAVAEQDGNAERIFLEYVDQVG